MGEKTQKIETTTYQLVINLEKKAWNLTDLWILKIAKIAL